MNDAFITHGIFELIASIITFLGILLALDNRIVSNYDDLLVIHDARIVTINKAMRLKILDKDDPKAIELFQVHYFDREFVKSKRDDYKYYHFAYSIFGIMILIGYGIILLTNEIDYTFFVTWVVVLVGMAPALIYLIYHVRVMRQRMKEVKQMEVYFISLNQHIKDEELEKMDNNNSS